MSYISNIDFITTPERVVYYQGTDGNLSKNENWNTGKKPTFGDLAVINGGRTQGGVFSITSGVIEASYIFCINTNISGGIFEGKVFFKAGGVYSNSSPVFRKDFYSIAATNIYGGIFDGKVVIQDGQISNGTFNSDVISWVTISPAINNNPIFNESLENYGEIAEGTCNGLVTNFGIISGGTFRDVLNAGTILGGTINGVTANISLT